MRATPFSLCVAVGALLLSPGPARADDVAAFLERNGLLELLTVHLEDQLEHMDPADREETVLRLADLYTQLLDATDDPQRRSRLEERSSRLLADASESAGEELRLALFRGRYRAAERIAENHRLRQADVHDLDRAREILAEIIPQLNGLRRRIGDRLRVTERRLMRSSGGEAVVLADRAERSQRLLAQATYLAAWSMYYQSWLHDRPDNARVAEPLFAEILSISPSRPRPDEVSEDLRSTEAIARSILGMALCRSMTSTSTTALRWLDLLEHDQTFAPLREQIPAWRMNILLEHGEFTAAQRVLESSGPTPPLPWIRLAAVHALEAREDNRQAADLARVAVAALAARGELTSVLALADRYGAEALGRSGFAFRYVRGVQSYQEARHGHGTQEPTGDAKLIGLYHAAAGEFEAAIVERDADRYPEAAASCRWLLGWCRFFEGRFAAAAEAFEMAADALPPEQAHEALWMAVVSSDRTTDADPEALAALIDKALQRHPSGAHASTLRLKRLMGAEPTPEVVEALLEIPEDSEACDVARRRAAEILFRLFRGAAGEQRLAYANEYLTVALPLENTVHGCRRLLEVALGDGVGRYGVAGEVLARLDSLDPAEVAAHRDEIDYRRVLERLGAGATGEAAALADAMWQRGEAAPWTKLAQGALFRHGLGGDDFDMVVRYGRRVVADFADDRKALTRPRVLAYHAAVAEALAKAGARGDPGRTEEALALYERLLAARPLDARFLRATGLLAEKTGRTDLALSCWRTLVASASRDPGWYEAKFHLISILAEVDRPRAREVMDQHKRLNPDYGPQPWAARLRALDERLQ